MKLITYNSENFYLFTFRSDDSRRQVVEFYIPSRLHSGASDREARPALGASLRVSNYRFTTVLAGYEPRQLKNALRAKTQERLMVPFWPGAMPQSEFVNTQLQGGLNISWEADEYGGGDFSTYEIHTGLTPGYTPTANTWTAPLLIGHFEQEPDPDLETDELQDLTISFTEDSEEQYALEVDAQSYTAGPTLDDPKYLFPLRHDFSRAARAGGTQIVIDRNIIGQGRRSTDDYYGAQAHQYFRYSIPFGDLDEACLLIRFFQDMGGISQSFWLPGHVAEARLQSDVNAVATSLQVDDPSPFSSLSYIALCDRLNIVPAQISSVVSNTLNLAAAPGAFTAIETSVCALLLVRFSKMRLRMVWDGGVGESTIEFKELRPEVSAPSGETIGETLGSVPRACSLYELTDGTNTWRFTSYERDLSYGGNDYLAHPITHGEIERTIMLDDRVSVIAEPVEGSPILGYHRHQIPRLWIKVWKAEASGAVASNLRSAFYGELVKCPLRASQLEASCVVFGRDFDLPPKGRFQVPCWYHLFNAGCGLLKANWTFSAEFTDVGTAGFPYTFMVGNITRDNLAALPGGFGFLNWFAWGWIEIGGQKLQIQSSTAISSGEITLNLEADPDPFPSVTDTLKLIPACDGKWVTCKAYDAGTNPRGKFGNSLNWGGHMVAAGNLSLVKVSSAVGGGKK